MDGLKLPIDSRTLEASISSRKLREIDVDGNLIYEESDSSDNRLTERLGRIWDEYPNGLLELTDARVGELDPEARAVEEQEEQEVEEQEADRSKPMPYHEMQKLREGLADQLNTARNELWSALELAKTLSVSADHTTEPPSHPHQQNTNRPKKPMGADKEAELKGEPPVLPAGSYTATPATVQPRSQHAQIVDQELALAAKHQALDECSALIDSAVEELQVMSEAGERFWRDIRQLKEGKGGRGRWAIVPKPDFTRTMTKGEMAKDVVIPYAVDEAPSAMRARCLAAFDLDPSKTDALAFGSRGYRRLRVSLHTDVQTSSSSLPAHELSADIHIGMEAAQLEALDEDLYNEIQNELSRHPDGTVTSQSASLDIGDRRLVFEMCDIRSSPPNINTSDICDTIALAVRLSLLQQYRRRKMRLVGHASPSSPILLPIVQNLQFQAAYQSIQSALQMFVLVFTQADLHAVVDVIHPIVDDKDSQIVQRILAGQLGIGGTNALFKLRLEDCPGIAVDLAVPATCVVKTSTAEFSVQDLGDLPSILADDLAQQLLLYAKRIMTKAVDVDHRSQVFLDDLETVVRLPLRSGLQIAIRPPFSGITALIDGPLEDRYDSKGDEGFAEWLHAIATRVTTSTAM